MGVRSRKIMESFGLTESGRSVAIAFRRLLWGAARLVVLAALIACAPLVRAGLTLIAAASLLAVVVYSGAASAAHFPTRSMLAIAAFSVLGRLAYDGVIQALTRR
jgi:hypothetical protein